MNGEDVKRQVMGALRFGEGVHHRANEALAPCDVVTAAERSFIRKIVRPDLRPEWKRELDRILTPDSEGGNDG